MLCSLSKMCKGCIINAQYFSNVCFFLYTLPLNLHNHDALLYKHVFYNYCVDRLAKVVTLLIFLYKGLLACTVYKTKSLSSKELCNLYTVSYV